MELLSDVNERERQKNAGRKFGRWARAMALAKGNVAEAVRVAERMRWIESDSFAAIAKASVAAGTLSDANAYYPIGTDLATLETKLSAVRAMQNLFRRVPSNLNVITQQTGATAYWIGEGGGVPLSSLVLAVRTSLTQMRLQAMNVITDELAQSADAEFAIAYDHARAKGEKLDNTFFDPANAGSPEALPKSITRDARQFVSSGSAVASIDADLYLLLSVLSAGGSNLKYAHWIMRPETGAYLGLVRGSGGSPCYPGVGALGGELLGLPVLTTGGIAQTGSPPESIIVLCDPTRVWFADDGATFAASRTATVEMDNAPGNNSANPTGAAQVSMFQSESTALLSTSHVNWRTVDDSSAAVVLTRVTY